MRFFMYNFMAIKSSEQIIGEINQITEATKEYDRSEDMMFFALVPFTVLEAVLKGVDRKLVKIGVQNAGLEKHGLVSGEVSLPALKEMRVDMIQTGAVDRRQLLGETNEIAAEKHTSVLRHGFKSILCVGETKKERENRTALTMVAKQVATGFSEIPEDAFYRTGVVYEPYWTIGEAVEKTEEGYLCRQIKNIRRTLADTQPDAPEPLPVFYGGRMDRAEAVKYLKKGLVDGIVIDDRIWETDAFICVVRETMQ